MATRRLGNVHQQIEEVRSRLFLQRWDTITYDVQTRLHDLGKLIGTEAGDELHRHVVVGAIAALETFHRGMIVSIVDSSDEYKSRAAESITEKFSTLSNARAAGSAGWLKENHREWMKATMDWERGTYGSLRGTMWPAIRGADLAKAIRTRAEQVIGWNRSQNFEDPPE